MQNAHGSSHFFAFFLWNFLLYGGGMPTTQGPDLTTMQKRGAKFRELHERRDAFIAPNPWDVGTAKVLEALGYQALATTSSGYAFSAGLQDGDVDRQTMLAHIGEIAAAVALPVTADLETGYGDSPDLVAETIRDVGDLGVVGGSIEDRSDTAGGPGLYDLGLAVERIEAAAGAASSLGFDFTLTARCENYLIGNPDLDDTIARLQAYQEAGADVLYAPGLRTQEEIRAVVQSVDRPINVVVGLAKTPLTRSALADLGVGRISVGSALSRAAWAAFVAASSEMINHGTFDFAGSALSHGELTAMFAPSEGEA